jgi:hypothetical protein
LEEKLSTETLIGTGTNVFTSDAPTVGKIRFLDSPEEVLDFIDGPDVTETIVMSREFAIPCVMSTAFTDGIQTPRGETIPADGSTVRLDITGDKGQVFLLGD